MSDGTNTIYVSIEDQDFVHRVQASEESFRKGDILRARVRRTEWQTTTGQLKADNVIEKIHEHQHSYQQMKLDVQPPPDNPSAEDSSP